MLQENKETSYFYKAKTIVMKRHDSDRENYFNISYFHSVCLSR